MTKLTSDVKLTWDDLLLFPEDGKKHEIIDGEHFVTATPVRRHQVIVMNLGGLTTLARYRPREYPILNVPFTTAVFYALPFLVALMVIVFVHEFGHFIVARWCGVTGRSSFS